MKIEEMKRADCTGCAACANICPRNAISMIRDAEGFAYPKINRELCIKCGRCDSVCPSLNFTEKKLDVLPATFAAIYPDEKILRHSSSGGIFTALSEIILHNGGIVFGAAFDKNWRVFHTCVQTLDELESLRGSKYVQSQIGDVYRQVKDALKSRLVLFSGTPCQCAGLKHFLGNDPENLLTVDVICHGAPSPAVWENYIGEFTGTHEVYSVNFRNKRNGWRNFCFEVNFFDQGYYSRPINVDMFGRIFLNNLTLRPSCHTCKFKFPNGKSDLTLGDAWGIKNFAPEMLDDRGVSVVFVHTAKGKNFFRLTNLTTQQVKFVDAAINNPSFMIPLFADDRRENFFADFARLDDKFAVMQKYFYQDDTTFRQKVREKNQRALLQRWQVLAAQIRNNFKQNILVVTSSPDDNARIFWTKFFEREFKNRGVYILQYFGNEAICTETFSSLNFTFGNVAALSEALNFLHIAEIYVEEPLNSKSDVFTDWIKTCGLPVKLFSLESD